MRLLTSVGGQGARRRRPPALLHPAPAFPGQVCRSRHGSRLRLENGRLCRLETFNLHNHRILCVAFDSFYKMLDALGHVMLLDRQSGVVQINNPFALLSTEVQWEIFLHALLPAKAPVFERQLFKILPDGLLFCEYVQVDTRVIAVEKASEMYEAGGGEQTIWDQLGFEGNHFQLLLEVRRAALCLFCCRADSRFSRRLTFRRTVRRRYRAWPSRTCARSSSPS